MKQAHSAHGRRWRSALPGHGGLPADGHAHQRLGRAVRGADLPQDAGRQHGGLPGVDTAGYADLRPVHGMVFQALRGAGATSSELADRLGVTKQAAGQIVDEMEKRGYVRRQPHPAGGRRRLVVLTEKAHRHLAVAGRVLHDLEAELAGRLGEAELAGLRVELARLVREIAGGPLPPLRPLW